MDQPEPVNQAFLALNRAWVSQQLLRGLAHDLRNHLQVLALGVGSSGNDLPSVGPRLEAAIDGTSAGLDLLSQLGRADSLGERPADLGTCLERLPRLADLQRNYPARPVTLVGDPGAGCHLDLTTGETLQLLLNLVAGAKLTGGATTNPVAMAVHRETTAVTLTMVQPGMGEWLALPADDASPECSAAQACRMLIALGGGESTSTPADGLDIRWPTIARG